jgi:hypothetical protein
MSVLKWTKKVSEAAMWLAAGHTIKETAEHIGKNERTVYRWKADIDFSAEVDRLSLMTDIASRAERVRIAMRAARQSVLEDGKIKTEKDLLEWLKFAQSETDGIKLDLASVAKAYSSVAGGRPDGDGANKP